jgi:hypothetical protein
VRYIASDAEYEKEWEKDDSPIPAKLRAWLTEGAAILVAMTQEETDELLASVAPRRPPQRVALSAEGDLAKAGARHSKSDVEKLQSAHDALVALGAACACDDADKSASGDCRRPRRSRRPSARSPASATSSRSASRNSKQMPAEAKGVVRVVGKTDDSEDVQKRGGPPAPDPKDPVSVMKNIHATGGQRVII